MINRDVGAQNCQGLPWGDAGPANGKSGANYARDLIARVRRLQGVRAICDLGCGNGYLAGELAALGYEVLGIDVSRSGIELANRHYPKASFMAGIIDQDILSVVGDIQVDLVISSDVIEHLYCPSNLLSAAAKLLPEGGHLVVGTPYHGYWKNVALSVTGRMDAHFTALWDGGHIKFFSPDTLSRLVTLHGFENPTFCFSGRFPYLWKNMICHARKAAE